MRAFLLRKGTIIITILITKIQAAARGLNTRTSLTKFFKACPPSGRTTDLFLSRVYGGHEGGGGAAAAASSTSSTVCDLLVFLSPSRKRWLDSLSKSTTLMTQCAAATEPSGSATNTRSCNGEQLCLPPPSSPSSSREPPCPSHPEHDLWRASQPHSAGAKKKKKKTSEQADIASREGGALLSTPHPPPSMW